MKQEFLALVVDDEIELRTSLCSIIESSLPEFQVRCDQACNGEEAIERLQDRAYDMILMDVRMPKMNGLDALEAIMKQDPSTFVVLMTAHSHVQDAVRAIKEGAYDYLIKPVRPEQIKKIVKNAMEARELVSDFSMSKPTMIGDETGDLVSESEKMKDVYRLIHKLSQVDTTVLIRGENGTGKEVVARAIHCNSPRKSGPFIGLNCAAIPENLIESELFGHERGAFTGAVERKIGVFQLANNGTLLLDEIAELKPELQAKLLRVLQNRIFTPVGGHREVMTNARIIAATNQNLEQMIQENRFREDLFYRLNVMPVFLPPLRERPEDIEELVYDFIRKFSGKHRSAVRSIAPDAMAALKAYQWPGNIRELENAIERAFVLEETAKIQITSLPEPIQKALGEQFQSKIDESTEDTTTLDFETFKSHAEREFIIRALRANQGRINKTVTMANIPKNTLLRKIRKYNINPLEFAKE